MIQLSKRGSIRLCLLAASLSLASAVFAHRLDHRADQAESSRPAIEQSFVKTVLVPKRPSPDDALIGPYVGPDLRDDEPVLPGGGDQAN